MNLFAILLAIAQDIPAAVTLIQQIQQSSFAQEIEEQLGLHYTVTQTPGNSAVIEPKGTTTSQPVGTAGSKPTGII